MVVLHLSRWCVPLNLMVVNYNNLLLWAQSFSIHVLLFQLFCLRCSPSWNQNSYIMFLWFFLQKVRYELGSVHSLRYIVHKSIIITNLISTVASTFHSHLICIIFILVDQKLRNVPQPQAFACVFSMNFSLFCRRRKKKNFTETCCNITSSNHPIFRCNLSALCELCTTAAATTRVYHTWLTSFYFFCWDICISSLSQLESNDGTMSILWTMFLPIWSKTSHMSFSFCAHWQLMGVHFVI
jgi:hypothetical protein